MVARGNTSVGFNCDLWANGLCKVIQNTIFYSHCKTGGRREKKNQRINKNWDFFRSGYEFIHNVSWNSSSTICHSIDLWTHMTGNAHSAIPTASLATTEDGKGEKKPHKHSLHSALQSTSSTSASEPAGIRFVTSFYCMWWKHSASGLIWESKFSTISQPRRIGKPLFLSFLYIYAAALFCDKGWWGGCYFDRNTAPFLALTTPVMELV